MPDFAVCVTFTLRPGRAGTFRPLAEAQARASLAEPGCRVFDVWTDPERPDELFLYEIYDSAAAFQAHLGTSHFKRFDAETAEMVTDKRVVTWASRADREGDA